MGDIDFLQRKDSENAKKNGSKYDIEYTQPTNAAPIKPVPKRKWFSFFKRNSAKAPRAKTAEVKTATETTQSAAKIDPSKRRKKASKAKFSKNVVAPTMLSEESTKKTITTPPPQTAVLTVNPEADVVQATLEKPASSQTVITPPVTKAAPAPQPLKPPILETPTIQHQPLPAPAKVVKSQVDAPVASAPTSPHPQSILKPLQPMAPAAPATSNTTAAAPVARPVMTPKPAVAAAPVRTSSSSNVAAGIATPSPIAATAPKHNTDHVIAQHVENLSGEHTNPKRLEAAPFTVDLLPSHLVQKLHPTSPITRLLNTALVTLVVVGAIYGGLVGYESYYLLQTKDLQTQLTTLDQNIQQYRVLQTSIDTDNKKLQAINDLLAKHIYWTQFFDQLEQYTLPNVQYTNFSGNTTGTITLQALTTDYAAVSHQIAVLKNADDFIESVSASSATLQALESANKESSKESLTAQATPQVSFSMSIKVRPEIFYRHSYDNVQ